MVVVGAQPDGDAELLETVLAALDGDAPDRSLEAALSAFRARGLAEPDEGGQAWLELSKGERELRLTAAPGVEPPGRRTRALLAHALGVALARLRERDEARKVAERLELLQAASFEGILIHDGGNVVDCNERLSEMVGYTREEIFEPGHVRRVVAPEDFPEVEQRIRQKIEGEFLVTCVRKDGTRIRAEFCTKQTQLGDRPFRVVAFRDVTERERTAALLRESEARLKALLEATFDGVATMKDGVLVDVSEGLERFLGVPRSKLLGRSALELVAPSSRGDVARRIQDKTLGAYEGEAIAAGGELAPVLIVPVESTLDGEPVRVAALRDLREMRRREDERRQLELQVERSQRLESLGVLASGIAHDFNNILVGVLGGAEVLLTALEDPDLRAQAEAIRTAGQRAASLTKQMLAYAGRRSLTTTEPVDLAELWQELRTLLDAALSKKATVELDFAPDSVVLGERSALMQVFNESAHQRERRARGQAGAHLGQDGAGERPRRPLERFARRARAAGQLGARGGARHRRRHGRGDASAHLRAVLLDESARPRARARVVSRHRQGSRGRAPRGELTGGRQHLLRAPARHGAPR